MERNYKIGFDIGGVLSREPEVFKAMISAFRSSPIWETYILTDMPKEKAESLLQANNIDYDKENLLCADWNESQEMCKAELVKKHGLDILVDDHLGYVTPEEIPIGLLVVPRPKKPYNSPEWKLN
jgi:hypothetical protein